MTEKNSGKKDREPTFYKRLEASLLLTVIGIIILFSSSIAVILVAPTWIDPTWHEPSSDYQVQMYEISDPSFYIGTSASGARDLQCVRHLVDGKTLLAFRDTDAQRIVAPKELEPYITKKGEPILKLTSRLLLLKPLSKDSPYYAEGQKIAVEAQNTSKDKNLHVELFELFDPGKKEAFSLASPYLMTDDWVDHDFTVLDPKIPFHHKKGVIFVSNPKEYRIKLFTTDDTQTWKYDPSGEPVASLEMLKNHALGFRSRKELIEIGESLYATEGCWYCHTDQTRTLVQDVVLNGSPDYPSPPSTANEYIYQDITFPGTRRIGPDLSRTGVKKPSRDWHRGHFYVPKLASQGSIMPAFRHFFDDDPAGTAKSPFGIPNYKFEAMFQYLMTKGTRITPPTQAWWLGKDPVDIIKIVETDTRKAYRNDTSR